MIFLGAVKHSRSGMDVWLVAMGFRISTTPAYVEFLMSSTPVNVMPLSSRKLLLA
jgi:hypothetical protein